MQEFPRVLIKIRARDQSYSGIMETYLRNFNGKKNTNRKSLLLALSLREELFRPSLI
jgi:tRNA A37 threonylcarbamoyltransferase TsaD